VGIIPKKRGQGVCANKIALGVEAGRKEETRVEPLLKVILVKGG